MEQRTKDDIRQEMRERRREVSDERRRYTGKVIAEHVDGGEIALTRRAWRVSIYLSTKHEISTRHIRHAVWAAGRNVCVPAWSPDEAKYCLCELHPMMRLVTGKHGIREPVEQIHLAPWDADAFILPGLAFDAHGGRLGYGKGIYDGILSKANRAAIKIGICYDWQILSDPLPLEQHDMSVDWVVSDKRIINCKKTRG
ncbi:MAG: 5-formyltetrahydrofolate cyclo-ligase [Kiritimatiellaeota bacterium]|nr:5-formyltetrahydrofolate cyclo-ligase [Kiritimatiellota bacterium]